MKKVLLATLLLTTSLVFIGSLAPNSIKAAIGDPCNPGAATNNNCGFDCEVLSNCDSTGCTPGELCYWNEVPFSVCEPEWECRPEFEGAPNGCYPCDQECSEEGGPCVIDDDCCTRYLSCISNICTVSEPRCTVNTGLCGDSCVPDPCPSGEGEDGPCCSEHCTLNPFTDQWACRDPGDICRAQDGECKDDCNEEDEQPLPDHPNLDCPSGQLCCVYDAPQPTQTQLQAPPQEVFCLLGNTNPDQRTSNPESGMIATAIGCIPVRNQQEFVAFLLRWGAGISGGIALILIVVAGIMFISSSGDPKRMQAAKELLTAAIGGLLLLIFGVFILEFIGVDILGIPGFGS